MFKNATTSHVFYCFKQLKQLILEKLGGGSQVKMK